MTSIDPALVLIGLGALAAVLATVAVAIRLLRSRNHGGGHF